MVTLTPEESATLKAANLILEQLGKPLITPRQLRRMGLRAARFHARRACDCAVADASPAWRSPDR